MAAKVWNTGKESLLLNLYHSGNFTTKEMANKIGVTQRTVYNRLGHLGLPTTHLPRRHRGHGKIDFTKDEKEKIVAWKQDGMFTTTIALNLGKSRTAVLRIIRELGLKNSNLLPLKPGERFGSLTVVGPAEPTLKGKTGFRMARSVMRCECGKELALPNHAVRCGNTKSCGGFAHRQKIETPWNRMLHQVRGGARQRGISMTLSKEQVKSLVLMQCAYCKQIGSNRMQPRLNYRTAKYERMPYNGIDQIVPSGGYHLGNVVPCCCICNRAKRDLSLAEFIAWLASIGSKITEKSVLEHAIELKRQLTS